MRDRQQLLELRDTATVHLAASRLKHRAALAGDVLDRAFAPMWAQVVERAETNLRSIQSELEAA